MEVQYQQTLTSTLNNLNNNFQNKNHSRPLSNSNSRSILLNNNEEKYSFYANFDMKPLKMKNLDFNNFNDFNKINNNNNK